VSRLRAFALRNRRAVAGACESGFGINKSLSGFGHFRPRASQLLFGPARGLFRFFAPLPGQPRKFLG